jgi:hypothetical protein
MREVEKQFFLNTHEYEDKSLNNRCLGNWKNEDFGQPNAHE